MKDVYDMRYTVSERFTGPVIAMTCTSRNLTMECNTYVKLKFALLTVDYKEKY